MLKKIVISVLVLFSVSSVFAGTCFVIGYHHGRQYDGPTFCGNGQQGGIDVNGVLTSKGTIFTGNVSVMGPTLATSSVYQNMVVSSAQTYFTSTTVGTIEELNNGSPVQAIYLNSGSTVQSIKFDANNGVVYVDGTSHVGSVTGGKIVPTGK